MIRKTFMAATVGAAVILGASAAQADTFSFNFCPGDATCNADLTEASITFQTVDGTADVNDYMLTIRFIGTLTNVFIDSVDFTAGLQFASLPVLTSAPNGTILADWTTLFDKVNNGGGCAGDIPNHKFACSRSVLDNGPDFAGTNEWLYSINFTGTGVVSATSPIDLRALFVDANGRKVGAVMGPERNFVSTTTTVGQTTSGTSVPEPTLLSMLGVGLAIAARRLRKA